MIIRGEATFVLQEISTLASLEGLRIFPESEAICMENATAGSETSRSTEGALPFFPESHRRSARKNGQQRTQGVGVSAASVAFFPEVSEGELGLRASTKRKTAASRIIAAAAAFPDLSRSHQSSSRSTSLLMIRPVDPSISNSYSHPPYSISISYSTLPSS